MDMRPEAKGFFSGDLCFVTHSANYVNSVNSVKTLLSLGPGLTRRPLRNHGAMRLILAGTPVPLSFMCKGDSIGRNARAPFHKSKSDRIFCMTSFLARHLPIAPPRNRRSRHKPFFPHSATKPTEIQKSVIMWD